MFVFTTAYPGISMQSNKGLKLPFRYFVIQSLIQTAGISHVSGDYCQMDYLESGDLFYSSPPSDGYKHHPSGGCGPGVFILIYIYRNREISSDLITEVLNLTRPELKEFMQQIRLTAYEMNRRGRVWKITLRTTISLRLIGGMSIFNI